MPRKTLDIDPELDALRAKIEKRLTSQKLTLGEIVLERTVHKFFDADQLSDALVRLRDEVATATIMGARQRGPPPGFQREAATNREPSPRAAALRISLAKLRRSEQALARLLKQCAMSDARDWRAQRRAR